MCAHACVKSGGNQSAEVPKTAETRVAKRRAGLLLLLSAPDVADPARRAACTMLEFVEAEAPWSLAGWTALMFERSPALARETRVTEGAGGMAA